MVVRFSHCDVTQAGYDVKIFGGKCLGARWIQVMCSRTRKAGERSCSLVNDKVNCKAGVTYTVFKINFLLFSLFSSNAEAHTGKAF